MTKKATMTAKSEAIDTAAADRLAMLKTLNDCIDGAYEGPEAATKGTGDEAKFIDMASIFGSMIHASAKALGWTGYEDMLEAIKAHDSFRYFGNPYDGKIFDCMTQGYIAKRTKAETKEQNTRKIEGLSDMNKALTMDLIALASDTTKEPKDIISEMIEINNQKAENDSIIAKLNREIRD